MSTYKSNGEDSKSPSEVASTATRRSRCDIHGSNCSCAGYSTPSNQSTRRPLRIFQLALSPAQQMRNETKRTGYRDTPPAKRFQKVRNPFDALLAEKLHRPLIDSPSLFNRPTTPQMSSTQFEWTIDEVSSLKPAELEVCETQFEDSPNPEFESRAQLAISSFFREQVVVPSPVDCPLRRQRIILAEINSNTPISKAIRVRDCEIQTELSLPPVLPPELEAALKPYFNTDLCGVGYEFRAERSYSYLANSSMRRKLFDMHNIVVVDSHEELPKASTFAGSSPISVDNIMRRTIAGKLSDSPGSCQSSFGSPISTSNDVSPNSAQCTDKRKRFEKLMDEDVLSPITPHVNIYRRRSTIKTLDDTLSELLGQDVVEDAAVNSSNERESTPNAQREHLELKNELAVISMDNDFSMLSATAGNNLVQPTIAQHCADDDEEQLDAMQVTQNQCLDVDTKTPKSSGRYNTRRNLSSSFNADLLDDDDDDEVSNELSNCKPNGNSVALLQPTNIDVKHRREIYRADSGFNETNGTASLTGVFSIDSNDAAVLNNGNGC